MLRHFTTNNASHLRTARGIAVVLLMLTYVFGGLLHGLTDFSSFSASATAVVMLSADTADTNGGHSDTGAAAEHHCHGCFSVSLPAPAQPLIVIEPRIATMARFYASFPESVPELDTPPPKFLI